MKSGPKTANRNTPAGLEALAISWLAGSHSVLKKSKSRITDNRLHQITLIKTLQSKSSRTGLYRLSNVLGHQAGRRQAALAVGQPHTLAQSCPWVGSTRGLGWVCCVGAGTEQEQERVLIMKTVS